MRPLHPLATPAHDLHPADARLAPHDQADGLRRLFAHSQPRFVPVVANPGIAFCDVMLERLCTAFTECGQHTLLVDASEQAPWADEAALVALGDCIDPLSPQASYLAARGLSVRHVDTHGSTAGFLTAVADAAPYADVVLVHASAAELVRLFAGRDVRPVLLCDDRPQSVTQAYASLKLLAHRAGLGVHNLLLCAAPNSPRAPRIAAQLSHCADDFIGAIVCDWAQIDPACDPGDAASPALRRLAEGLLGDVIAADVDWTVSPAFFDRPTASSVAHAA